MDLSRPKPVEERMLEMYTDARSVDALSHEEAIVEALNDAVHIGYDDARLARAARALVQIDEDYVPTTISLPPGAHRGSAPAQVDEDTDPA